MLQLHWIEIFLRLIPEALLMIWGIHVLARKRINIKNYMLSSVILALLTFLIRRLPIYFGIHTLIIIILTMVIVVAMGIPIIKAMYGSLLMFLIFTLSEFLNMVILHLLNINTNIQFENPIIKDMYGIPSLIIICIVIIAIRYFIKRKD